MRSDRFDRRVKWWWRSAEDVSVEMSGMDTQPIELEVGLVDFDAPGWRPVDVSVPKRTAESVLWELMEALREDGLH